MLYRFYGSDGQFINEEILNYVIDQTVKHQLNDGKLYEIVEKGAMMIDWQKNVLFTPVSVRTV